MPPSPQLPSPKLPSPKRPRRTRPSPPPRCARRGLRQAKKDDAKPAAAPAAGVEAKKDEKPAVKKPKPSDEIKWALAGFSNSTVWLIFIAFMFALGYEKTGLGKRISLVLIKKLGKRTLGLGYAVALADLALAPFMPSNTARSGGTILPHHQEHPRPLRLHPGQRAAQDRRLHHVGGLATTCVTSSMFFTGLAPNLLAMSLVEKTVRSSSPGWNGSPRSRPWASCCSWRCPG